MPRYTLQELEQIRGKQPFYRLFKDNTCIFDEFCNKIENEGRYTSELKMVFAYMEMVANLQMLPNTKMRNITPNKEKIKEYEIKTKHLRIYFIHVENTGKIVVLGGFKKEQNQDISLLRSIKKEFLQNKNI